MTSTVHLEKSVPLTSRAGAVRSMSPRRKKLAVFCAVFVLCGLIGWIATMVARSYTLYGASKGRSRGWHGSIYRGDDELGLAPIPFARADEIIDPFPDVPSHIDARGFRVPTDAGDEAPIVRPVFLALGCSGTFGSGVRAEETFGFRVAQQFGGTCLNAGLCSGGAAQQLLLARKLIPLYKPNYVLLQFSPWLIERARTPYAPTYSGKIPVPYFVVSGAGIRLEEPCFRTKAFDLPTRDYRSTESGLGDFLGFTVRAGLPLYAHDDICTAWTSLRQAIGATPTIATPEQIEAYVHPEIAALCSKHGVKLVVVAMRNGLEPWVLPESIRSLGVPIAYGTNRMCAELPERTRRYYNRTYLHMAGDPPVLVDAHPNAVAHGVIAAEIVDVIRREH